MLLRVVRARLLVGAALLLVVGSTSAAAQRPRIQAPRAQAEAASPRQRPGLLRRSLRDAGRRSLQRRRVLAKRAADEHVQQVMRHSETSGRYFVVSDLHWGMGRVRRSRRWTRDEEFRQPQAFSRFVRDVASRGRRNTLVIGGDWLELTGHLRPNATPEQVRRTVTRIVEGHRTEVRALTRAVARNGLRVVYVVGNHDVQLVDPRMREHLLSELARVGGLQHRRELERFRSRVAYSGHAAVLGRFGEGFVMHGHAQDPSNGWRSLMNPYEQSGAMTTNLGWEIVTHVASPAKQRFREETHREHEAGAVARFVRSREGRQAAVGVARDFSNQARTRAPTDELSNRLDDRVVMREWVQRTGFAERMARALPDATELPPRWSAARWAQRIEDIYSQMPRPFQDRMASGEASSSRLMNLVRLLYLAPRFMRRVRQIQPDLFRSLVARLHNVRFVMAGHTHHAQEVTGETTRGPVGFYNTGTWTRVGEEWRLNVAVARTDPQGRLSVDGVFRTERRSGQLEAEPSASRASRSANWWDAPRARRGANE